MPDERTESSSAPSEPRTAAGIDLRDYFAGQALAGICSASDEPAHGLAMQRKVADTAYQIADAMMARREERNE